MELTERLERYLSTLGIFFSRLVQLSDTSRGVVFSVDEDAEGESVSFVEYLLDRDMPISSGRLSFVLAEYVSASAIEFWL